MTKTTELRQQTFTAPATANNTGIHAAITLPTSGTTITTTGITNPDIPRTVRLKGNQATVQGLVATVVGTDMLDQPLTENVTMGGDYTVATDTLHAFKTVTSLTVPTRGAASDSISFGFGAALGLDSYCDINSFTGFSGASSFTYDPVAISLNTVVISGLDGATNQVVVYIPFAFPEFGRPWG